MLGNNIQLFLLVSFCDHSASDTTRLDHVTWNTICILFAVQSPEYIAFHHNYNTYCFFFVEKAQWFQLCWVKNLTGAAIEFLKTMDALYSRSGNSPHTMLPVRDVPVRQRTPPAFWTSSAPSITPVLFSIALNEHPSV